MGQRTSPVFLWSNGVPTDLASTTAVELIDFERVDSLDHVLILAASWEERCLGMTRRIGNYTCGTVALSVYDGKSELREEHLKELRRRLPLVGRLEEIPALHSNPLANVIKTIRLVRQTAQGKPPRLSIDISTFTRKHLLQLLLGLDTEGLLGSCRFFHTEPEDYDTRDNSSIAEGISNVKAIEAFAGSNTPSKDSVLIMFLGYEGTRALALWEHLEPNRTIAIIPDPPYKEAWRGRTEDQNRYLLSCLPKKHVFRSSAVELLETDALLKRLCSMRTFDAKKYKYQIAPFGTKPQTVGIYKFWRSNPGLATIMYASPTRYRSERASFPPGRTWYLGSSQSWTGT